MLKASSLASIRLPAFPNLNPIKSYNRKRTCFWRSKVNRNNSFVVLTSRDQELPIRAASKPTCLGY
jgi:hypothetical protein